MNKKLAIVLSVSIISIVFDIYHAWFHPSVISAGDLTYQSVAVLKTYPISFFAWNWGQGNGLGGPFWQFLPTYFQAYSVPILLFQFLALTNNSIERIIYFFPFLTICFLSPLLFYRTFIDKGKYALLASFIYLANTYILMLAAGGQVFIMLSYAWLPITLWYLGIVLTRKLKNNYIMIKDCIVLTSILGVQILLDVRIAYIAFIIEIIFYGTYMLFTTDKRNILYASMIIFLSTIFAVLLNGFWTIPVLFIRENYLGLLGSAYSSTDAVKYFSFADLPHTLGLLHPNWPENIFGKVSFMQPQYLLLPILAFGSLLFVGSEKKEKKLILVVFIILGLLGSFLAKGANDPLGNVYLWLFTHVPGFQMYRDPTKWYLLTSVSYAILIPYTLSRIENYFQKKK